MSLLGAISDLPWSCYTLIYYNKNQYKMFQMSERSHSSILEKWQGHWISQMTLQETRNGHCECKNLASIL